MDVCDFLRPILFLVLLFYAQIKFAITFDFAGNSPSGDEIRRATDKQLQRITEVVTMSQHALRISSVKETLS